MLQGIRLRLLALTLIAVLPFTALIGVGLWNQWRTDQKAAFDLAVNAAHTTAALVDDHVGSVRSLLSGLRYAVSTDPADTAANDALFRRVKAALPAHIANILLFAPDGRNIGVAEGERFSAADRDYFRKVLAGDDLAIGEPVLGRAVGSRIIPIARPVKDGEGRLRAVVVVGTSIERFQRTLAGGSLPENSIVMIAGGGGFIMSDGADSVAPKVQDLARSAAGAASHTIRTTAAALVWSDGVRRITATSSTRRTPWLIAVGLPSDSVLAPLRQRLAWSVLFCISAITVSFIIAWMLSGRIVSPLRQLATDALKLADGELGHRTAVQSSDEVGTLAGSFNRMAAALQQRQEETLRIAEEMRQAKDTLAAVVEASPIAIACTSLDRKIILWNRAAEQTYGYTKDEAIGQHIKIVPPEETEQSREFFRRAIARETTRNVEVKRLRKDGSLVDINLSIAPMYNNDGSVRAVAWAHEDITDRKRAEEQLKQFAHFDQLTGLPNRVTMRTLLEERLARCRDAGATAIALFDLDGFKDVNDTLGHSTGDRLLIEVGRRLAAVAESQMPSCRVCRLGGDEFVAIMPDCGDPRLAATIVLTMLKSLAEPFEIAGDVLHVAGSAGIAIAPNDGATVDELIANADLALYQAKRNGGGKYRFFVPSMRAKVQSRRMLDADLRRAFEGREFELYYQPQVRLADGAVVGLEALLRWNHPVRGVVPPAMFIDALEDSPLAPQVGRWIIGTACAQIAAWRAAGFGIGRIAVNLFSSHLQQPGLIDDVAAALDASGLPAEALELEIIENVALSNESSIKPLQRLHERGVNLAFDDFGTGYASLSYLTLFPVSHIKIDRSFVARLTDSEQDAAIVRSLIAMANSLDLDVIAEGVETEEQANVLVAQGCREAQGYLYSPPLRAADLERYLCAAQFAEAMPGADGRAVAAFARPAMPRPPRRRRIP